MTTFIKTKLNELGDQMNIDKNRVAALQVLQNISYVEKLILPSLCTR